MIRIETGQKLQTRDFAQLLAGQTGTFLVSAPGVATQLVVCEEGHSIKSIRRVGSDYPTVPLGSPGNSIWDVEKLNGSTEIMPEIEPISQGRREMQAR